MSHRDDIVLCSIVINGSGQDANQMDYQIADGKIRYAIRHGRMAEINAAFWALGKRLHEIETDYVDSTTPSLLALVEPKATR